MKRISCKERLRELQKEFKYKPEHPEYSSLPVIHLKKEKIPKSIRKKHKQDKASIALDILYNLFTDEYAVYLLKTMEYDELVDYCIDWAEAWKDQLVDRCDGEPLSVLDPESPSVDDFDIPDDEWKSYLEYEKKHKPKNFTDVMDNRKRFKKHVKKGRKRYYKKGLMIYDPLFKHSHIDEQQMIKNLKRISRENEQRTKEFAKMMNDLVGDNPANQKILKSFEKHTAEVHKRVKRQIRDIEKSAPKTPLPFTISD